MNNESVGRFQQADCFRELSKGFSQEYIPKFRQVFEFVRQHAGQEYSQIRRLHLGYTAMREPAYYFIADHFSWLEDFRLKFNLEKKINFLETNGLDKCDFLPHIDGDFGKPSAMLNLPLLNCTNETTTYWVEPLEPIVPVLLSENATNSDKKSGATPHIPPGTPTKMICEHSFTDRGALFRSDIFHGVKNRSSSPEPRIMMHWWFSSDLTWNQAVENLSRLQLFE